MSGRRAATPTRGRRRARASVGGRPSGRRSLPVLPLIFALAMLGSAAAIYAGFQGFWQTATYQEAPIVAQPFSDDDPDTYTGETEPPISGPMTLAIPSLDVGAPIIETGVDAAGALILPTSESTTRFTGAAPIGAAEGSTVIAGHVNFEDGSAGALAPIAGIAKGAPVYVTDVDGVQHEYRVTTAQTLIKTQLPAELFSTTGSPQLVLITCGGPIEDTGNGVLGYTHNTVITAVPIPANPA